eukprot:984304_1
MTILTALLVVVLAVTFGRWSQVFSLPTNYLAYKNIRLNEQENKLLAAGKIRDDEKTMKLKVPNDVQKLIRSFMPEEPPDAISIRLSMFGKTCEFLMGKDGLGDFMKRHCSVEVIKRGLNKYLITDQMPELSKQKYIPTNVEFKDPVTRQPISRTEAMNRIWVDFQLNMRENDGVFQQILKEALSGKHAYKIEANCGLDNFDKSASDHSNLQFVDEIFHDFCSREEQGLVVLHGLGKSVQAKFVGRYEHHICVDTYSTTLEFSVWDFY